MILRRPNLRYPFPDNFAQQLEGQTITGIRRRAKYLLIDTDGDLVFLSHLGMSGKYTIFDAEQVGKYDISGTTSDSVFGEKTGFEGRHDHMEIRFTDGSISVIQTHADLVLLNYFIEPKNRYNRYLRY